MRRIPKETMVNEIKKAESNESLSVRNKTVNPPPMEAKKRITNNRFCGEVVKTITNANTNNDSPNRIAPGSAGISGICGSCGSSLFFAYFFRACFFVVV